MKIPTLVQNLNRDNSVGDCRPLICSRTGRRTTQHLLAAAFLLLTAHRTIAATFYWEGDTSNVFSESTNWFTFDGSGAPTVGDLVNFSYASYPNQPQFTANASVAGLHVNFGSTAVSLSALSPATTLTIGASGLYNGSSNTFTINDANLGLLLGTSAAFWSNTTLTIGSGISALNLGGNALTLTGTAPDASIAKGITSSGAGSLIKDSSGTWTLSGIHSYTGGTTVEDGVLKFTGTGSTVGSVTLNSGILQLGVTNAFVSTTAITLNGGALQVTDDAYSQNFGGTALSLTATSTLDFGSGLGATTLSFGASNLETWTGSLNVTNYNVGSDILRFGTDNTGLTTGQLSQILINGQAAQWAGSDGSVSPVPEPATYAALLGVVALAVTIYKRRRASSATLVPTIG